MLGKNVNHKHVSSLKDWLVNRKQLPGSPTPSSLPPSLIDWPEAPLPTHLFPDCRWTPGWPAHKESPVSFRSPNHLQRHLYFSRARWVLLDQHWRSLWKHDLSRYEESFWLETDSCSMWEFLLHWILWRTGNYWFIFFCMR